MFQLKRLSSSPLDTSAPADTVWALWTDFSTWDSWNTFVPKYEILSRNDISSTSKTVEIGMRLKFHLFSPPGHSRGIGVDKVKLLEIAPPASESESERRVHRLHWWDDKTPGFLLRAIRVMEVEETSEDRARGECEFRTMLYFEGALAWLVALTIAWVRDGFEASADGLKAEAEKRAKHS